ncbi:hypothetical protein [Streptococcus halichoeri]|uniref:hypothetical protein n=1 Tax=Streptococcus halichoeri TaxID=254785 RepID=UPI0013587F9C|nr:hypothetical protein [Streptococcus halichoeri]
MKLSKVACLMGSLTVLAGLMFTLGTRPVSAYDYYTRQRNPYSTSISQTETDFDKHKNDWAERAVGLGNNLEVKIRSVDDNYKFTSLKKEVLEAEADGAIKTEFERKLVTLVAQIQNLPESEKKNRDRMMVGYNYLSNMKYDVGISNSEKDRKFKQLEECLTKPSKVRKLNWCYN